MTEAESHTAGPRPPAVLEVMSREDCLEFLTGTTTVGRIGFRSSGGQVILPVNYVFIRGCVYFLTAPDSILAELVEGRGEVAFEIDYPDRLMQHGWSILVKGTAQGVSSPDVDLSPRAPRPWAPEGRNILIELKPAEITGRRIRNPL